MQGHWNDRRVKLITIFIERTNDSATARSEEKQDPEWINLPEQKKSSGIGNVGSLKSFWKNQKSDQNSAKKIV